MRGLLPPLALSLMALGQQGAPTPLLPREPVNARDCGAYGNCSRGNCLSNLTVVDCTVDDAPALQRAVDAAQLQGRSLFIPAGIYGVATPVVVRCTGGDDLVYSDPGRRRAQSAIVLCSGMEDGSGRVFHPLRISGEGMESTVLIATASMQAVLELGVGGLPEPSPYYTGGSLPNVTSKLHIRQLHLHANKLAQFGVHSAGIIQSRFSYLAATHALNTGIKLVDGFIIQVQDCTLAHNKVAGLHVNSNANAVEVRPLYLFWLLSCRLSQLSQLSQLSHLCWYE